MNPYYRIKRWLEDTRYNLKGRIQRFKSGYAYGDVWDMDKWFVNTIKPMLIHLRTHGCSYPMEFNSHDEWCAVLDQMINCLEFMDEDKVNCFFGFCDIDDYKRKTHEDYQRIGETMMKNKDRFFELFSMYFYNLWD